MRGFNAYASGHGGARLLRAGQRRFALPNVTEVAVLLEARA